MSGTDVADQEPIRDSWSGRGEGCLSMRLYNGRLRLNVAVMYKRARIPMGIARMRQQWPGNEAGLRLRAHGTYRDYGELLRALGSCSACPIRRIQEVNRVRRLRDE